jgi:hypothetical protein
MNLVTLKAAAKRKLLYNNTPSGSLLIWPICKLRTFFFKKSTPWPNIIKLFTAQYFMNGDNKLEYLFLEVLFSLV